MNGTSALLASAVTLAAACAVAWGDEPPTAADWVDRGNTEYRQGRLIDALDAYREADKLKPDHPVVAFDRGLALYNLGEFERAREQFNQALLTDDRRLEGRARVNLGNCDYANAVEAREQNPRQAIDLLKNAIQYYCDGLDLIPDDADAKANMQLARQLITQIEEQLQQQKQQQPQQDQQDEQQKDDQERQQQQQAASQPSQQEQQATSRPSDDQEKREDQQNAEQEQGEQGEQQRGGDQAEQQQAEQQQAEGQEGEEGEQQGLKMSKEQAQRLLQAIRDKERARRMEEAERRRQQPAPSGKDW